MRDSLRGQSQELQLPEAPVRCQTPVSWQVGTTSGSAAQRDPSLSREKSVHCAWYLAVPEGWEVGDTVSFSAPLSAQLRLCSISPNFFTVGMCLWLLAMVLPSPN